MRLVRQLADEITFTVVITGQSRYKQEIVAGTRNTEDTHKPLQVTLAIIELLPVAERRARMWNSNRVTADFLKRKVSKL